MIPSAAVAATGLTTEEVAQRRKQFGPNSLPESERKSMLRRILGLFAEPMLLLLLAAASLSFLVSDALEGSVLLGMVFLIIGITAYQEGRAEQALAALDRLSAPMASVTRNGVRQSISAVDLVPGDLIWLTEGDRVPADAKLLTPTHLAAEESALTGESLAVNKQPGDSVFSGTLIVSGRASAEVTATGVSTELGKIGKSLSEIDTTKTRLQHEVNRLVLVFAALAITVALTVAIVLTITRSDLVQGLLAGIATAMAIIPEELPVVLTIFLALGAWRMSQERVLTRRSAVIETLGSATVICVDKTGTLTMNSMVIDELIPWRDSDPELLAEVGALASPKLSFDPVDLAFLGHEDALRPGGTVGDPLREYPLHPELMATSQVWHSPEGKLRVATKGAPEAVMELCDMSDEERAEVLELVNSRANTGARLIAVGYTEVLDADDLPQHHADLKPRFIGLAALRDPIRAGVPAAIAECHTAGIRVIMITGDYPGTASAIAAGVGIENPELTLTGADLEQLSEAELAERVRTVNVFARMRPNQKLRLVRALQADGEVVAMTGDGVNDAPALKAADISLAMGQRGTDVAREAAALIITDDDFSSIVAGVRRGRSIYQALRRAMGYVIAVHMPLLGMAVLPIFFLDWPLVLIPVLVAFLEMVIDPSCTIVFQAEPTNPRIMKSPPRPRSQSLFNTRMVLLSVAQGVALFAAVAGLYLWSIAAGRPEAEVRSLTFTLMLFGNLALLLTNRSWTLPLWSTIRERKNPTVKWIFAVALAALALMMLLPPIREAFNLGELAPSDFLLTAGLAILSVSWFEIYKAFRFRRLSAQAA